MLAEQGARKCAERIMNARQAALRFGIPYYYLAYWRKTALLPEGDLSFQDLKKLQFIVRARQTGYSLQKIRSLVSGNDWLSRFGFQMGRIVEVSLDGFLEAGTRQFVLRLEAQTGGVTPLASREDLEGAYQDSLTDPAEQARLLDLILARDPGNTAAWIEKGNLAFEAGSMAVAERAYTEALQTDPNCTEALYNLANLYFRAGKHAAAIRSFMDCIANDPAFPEPYYNLGMLYYTLRMFDRSIMFLEMYRKMDPDSDWSERARKLVATMKSELNTAEGLFHD